MQAPPGFWNKATPSAGEKSVPFEKTAAAVLLGPDRDGRPIMHLGRLGGGGAGFRHILRLEGARHRWGYAPAAGARGQQAARHPVTPPQLARWPNGGALR